MERGALYPDTREAILEDYAYACTYTHRGIAQPLNLEAVVDHVTDRHVRGAIVECGTYTGGALAFTLRSLIRHGETERKVYGFDSFEGMPNPTAADGNQGALWILGKPLSDAAPDELSGQLTGCAVNLASYEQCLSLLRGTGYPSERIHLVKGWFQDTLPKHSAEIGPIAVLRLDGDLYESTKVCVETLYENVASDGVVIIDDYGTFEGCRKAVDEFLAGRGESPHLVYVDLGIRYFIKP